MKKIYVLLVALVATVSIQAQTQDNALYVYRNDGEFNAFLREEIDSIALSYFDPYGIEHKNPVYQLFFTSDSVYRIPVEAIDSVSFVQPEIIYNKNVVRMDQAGTCKWLKAADGMKLTFNSEMPYSAQPSKGDVLLYLKDNLPYFQEGFAGIVSSVSIVNNDIVVLCDSINDITDIFEQFVAIENIYVQEEQPEGGASRDSDQDNTNIPVNVDLSYEPDASCPIQFSISGGIDGNIALQIIYNITKEKQSFSITAKHDWTAHAKFSAKYEIPNVNHSWYPQSIPLPMGEIYFPAVCPVFKFSIYGSPFLKTEGTFEVESAITSPKNTYLTEMYYENGSFIGGTRQINGKDGDSPSLSSNFSLKGSVHTGGLIGMYIGTIDCVGVLGIGAELCIGPKLCADFSLGTNSDDDISLYNGLKDSKIDFSWLTLDFEMYGRAKFFGKGIDKHTFANASVSLFNKSLHFLPEFDEPEIDIDPGLSSALVKSAASRDLIVPVKLGLSIEDECGDLVETKWSEPDYWLENEWPENALWHKFERLHPGSTYTAYPYVRIFGYELKASPSIDFKIKEQKVKITNFKVTMSQYYEDGFYYNGEFYSYMFNTSVTLAIEDFDGVEDWGYVYCDPEGEDTFISLMPFGSPYTDTSCVYYRNNAESTVTLFGYVKYFDDAEYFFEEAQTFELRYLCDEVCDDADHVHAVDLGLSVKWACCNVGANSPEEYGGYYAWGETNEKSEYTAATYLYWVDKDGDGYYDEDESTITTDIAGTEYDVAHVKWGANWRMPRDEEIKELVNNCTWQWARVNGVGGLKVTGPNGNYIFLPAQGGRYGMTLDDDAYCGYYWSSTPSEYNAILSYCLRFDYLNQHCGHEDRVIGLPVRPVSE